VVLSSSHAVAKGAITGPGQRHIAYIHSPMRYAWDLQHQYLRQAGLTRGLASLYTRWLLHRLRLWDQASAARPDTLLANSHYIAERIQKAWRREARVLHPPVNLAGFPLCEQKQGHFLIASRQVPYKRIDLVAAAFAGMPGRRLVICGDGPELANVQAAVAGAPNITLRGRVSQAELLELVQSARGFVFAAEEDFGIGMVEALAAGTPVIAYGRGGAADIVAPGTGLLFAEQSADGISRAIEAFEAAPAPDPAACRAQAMTFSNAVFRHKLRGHVEALLGRSCASA
jgi:glycosyltransferase involved in cell wall biosynthesis